MSVPKAGFVSTLVVLLSWAFGDPGRSQSTILSGEVGGDDNWNVDANWSQGVPTGALNAIIGEGIEARVNNADTPAFTGNLSLRDGSSLRISGPLGTENAIRGVRRITLGEGASLFLDVRADLTLTRIIASRAEAIVALGPQTTVFTEFLGFGSLSISGSDGHCFVFEGETDPSLREFFFEPTGGYRVRANVRGAFGAADVSLLGRPDGPSGQLFLDVPDTILDTATLTLNGKGLDESDDVRITIAEGIDEVVGRLVLDDVDVEPGTYDSSEAWLSGEGTLTVAPKGHTIQFVRGDVDGNGVVNLTDGVIILNFLFLDGPAPGCEIAADVSGGGSVNITDGIFVLNYLFLGASGPVTPWPECGVDPNGFTLSCWTPPEQCSL
ncbi:MAG: dockerin type I domain-containing protein [Planctomycetota bacterium]